jgi:hypothetical protein
MSQGCWTDADDCKQGNLRLVPPMPVFAYAGNAM